MRPMLSAENLESGYGPMQVLWKPSLEIKKGSITSVLGPNGVGKTTLLKTIFGSVEPSGGKITYEGKDVTRCPTHEKVEMGIVLAPEGKHLFVGMSVHENLLMGAFPKAAMKYVDDSLDIVYSLFPVLKERFKQKAGLLSGGEQQMLTVARALMSRPKLVMLDEPSQGLAPVLAQHVFETIKKMKIEIDLTILLVEQNAEASLEAADYVYVMHEGVIKAEGHPADIKKSAHIREAYIGI
ncbi:MAG: ABC transporter ATP-binding protein [Desulfobacterales bacterium]